MIDGAKASGRPALPPRTAVSDRRTGTDSHTDHTCRLPGLC
jgi:hypothetical protein